MAFKIRVCQISRGGGQAAQARVSSPPWGQAAQARLSYPPPLRVRR